jgi:putative membrane protein
MPARTGAWAAVNTMTGTAFSFRGFCIAVVLIASSNAVHGQSLSEERGSEKTRQFVTGMLSEHTTASAQLKRLVSDRTVQVAYPMTLGSADQSKLNGLKKLTGPDFELEFDKAQIALHSEMVSLFQRYGSGGSHRDLKQFAYRHLPHMLEHWRLARQR